MAEKMARSTEESKEDRQEEKPEKQRQLTNLMDGIYFKLGLIEPEQLKASLNEEEKREAEKMFADYYENTSKTGFYISRGQAEDGDGDEEVQFFNYNKEGGWWKRIDDFKSTGEKGQFYLFFDKAGKLMHLSQADLNNKQKTTLRQFEAWRDLSTKFYEDFDYMMVSVFAPPAALGEFRLKTAQNDMMRYSNLAVSDVVEVSKSKDISRLTLFLSKYEEFKGLCFDDEAESLLPRGLFDLIDTIKPLFLVTPCIVKEEIKLFFNDFEPKSQKSEIRALVSFYAKEHRYECLFDSESEHSDCSSESSEDGEDGDVYVEKLS